MTVYPACLMMVKHAKMLTSVQQIRITATRMPFVLIHHLDSTVRVKRALLVTVSRAMISMSVESVHTTVSLMRCVITRMEPSHVIVTLACLTMG